MKIWKKITKKGNRRGRVSTCTESQLEGTPPGTQQDGTSLDSPASGSSDTIKTAMGALLSVLEVAKEASAPMPPLQAALGAAVASIKIYNVGTGSARQCQWLAHDVPQQKHKSNVDTIRTFKERVDPLVAMIQKLARSPNKSAELLQTLNRFDKYVHFFSSALLTKESSCY